MKSILLLLMVLLLCCILIGCTVRLRRPVRRAPFLIRPGRKHICLRIPFRFLLSFPRTFQPNLRIASISLDDRIFAMLAANRVHRRFQLFPPLPLRVATVAPRQRACP